MIGIDSDKPVSSSVWQFPRLNISNATGYYKHYILGFYGSKDGIFFVSGF